MYRPNLKQCAGCESLLKDEDERCPVCGRVWSESEKWVENPTVDSDFTKMVRRTRAMFALGIAALGFGIAASVGNGFGSVPLFILGIGMLPFSIWLLANVALAGFGKGGYRRLVELNTKRRGRFLFPSDAKPGTASEIREEEKHEDSRARAERKEEDFD